MGESLFHKSLREFERNPRPAKRFTWILTARLIGIDHGKRMRETVLPREVMVSDDEIYPSKTCTFCCSKRARSRIHADHEANTGGRGALDHISAQVVAFADTMRHVKVGRASAKFNRRFQNHDRRGAVHVVVAIDQNPLFALDGSVKTLHR